MAAENGAGIRELRENDPRMIGPYRLTGRLGAGGMGSVFAGLDDAGQQVAIKIVHAQFADDATFRARFTREVALLRRVRGTFATPVLDADVDAHQPWFATEFVPGPTLNERIDRDGPMHGDDLMGLAAGLAEALVAIHEAGVVHRDLKPQNIICSPTGPRVLDLGIARSAEDQSLTRTGMMIGSPAWMSPERFRGADSTPAADVYAWGMLVVFAATGVIPFGTGSPEVVALRVLSDRADTSGVPAPLRAVVEAAADPEPTRRPSARDALAAVTSAWRGVLGSAPAPALDPVAEATSLIQLHWGGPDGGPPPASPGFGVPVPPPPSRPMGPYGGTASYSAPSYGATAPGVAASGVTATGASLDPYGAGENARPLYREDMQHVPGQRSPAGATGVTGAGPHQARAGDTLPGGIPQVDPGGYPGPVTSAAHAEPGYPSSADTPTHKAGGGRRAGGAGRGGTPNRRPLVIAGVGVVVVAAVATVVAVLSNNKGDGPQAGGTQPPSFSAEPGIAQGPQKYTYEGMKLDVPSGWEIRPQQDDSLCLTPVDQPLTDRQNCMRGGLRVEGRVKTRLDINGSGAWAAGQKRQCAADSADTGKPVSANPKGTMEFPKLGDLTYDYNEWKVTCSGGATFAPRVWWLPQSKIAFSTAALPERYQNAVTQIIASLDKSGYSSKGG